APSPSWRVGPWSSALPSPWSLPSSWPSGHPGYVNSLLERDLFAAVRRRLVVHLVNGPAAASCGPPGCRPGLALAPGVRPSCVEQFDVIDHDLVLRPLLAGRLVIPRVVSQLAFDQNLRPLLAIVRDNVHEASVVVLRERLAIDVERVRVIFP